MRHVYHRTNGERRWMRCLREDPAHNLVDKHGQSPSRGFSLIELLVVISIIAMLLSILLPALSKAQSTAWGISCRNNLKQLGCLLHLYADDSNGYMPKCLRLDDAGGIPPKWDMTLSSLYLSGNKYDSKWDVPLFQCPATLSRHKQFCTTDESTINSGDWANCYIPNAYSIKSYLFVGDVSCVRMNQILMPASNILLLDRKVGISKALGAGSAGWPLIDDLNSDHGRVGYYHTKGVDVLWADGHCSWAKGGDLLNSNFQLSGE